MSYGSAPGLVKAGQKLIDRLTQGFWSHGSRPLAEGLTLKSPLHH